MSFCFKCETPLVEGANFCAKCGAPIHLPKKTISPRQIVTVLTLAAALFSFAWFTQQSLAGVKPTKSYEEVMGDAPAGPSPHEEEIRASLPQGLPELKQLATELEAKLAAESDGDTLTRYMFVLQALLEKSPNDPELVMKYANFTFDHQAFDQAAKLLRRYLELNPKDIKARTQLASALTFTNAVDESITILNQVIKEDPKNFHAHAYLAIALSQKGDAEKALAAGDKALKLAPSDEARKRFGEFLKTIANRNDSAEGAIVSFVSNHPIAGSKYKESSLKDGVLSITFNDFPMNAMPSFAKEKFYTGIKEQLKSAKTQDVQKVLFIDSATGKEMESLNVKQ